MTTADAAPDTDISAATSAKATTASRWRPSSPAVPNSSRSPSATDARWVLLWTWTSPNFDFATVFVGVIPIIFFGETFGQAILAIVLGTALGSVSMGVLSARGPGAGVPRIILSRVGFDYWGNWLPTGINSLVADIGWFAVNSVSRAVALHALIKGLPQISALRTGECNGRIQKFPYTINVLVSQVTVCSGAAGLIGTTIPVALALTWGPAAGSTAAPVPRHARPRVDLHGCRETAEMWPVGGIHGSSYPLGYPSTRSLTHRPPVRPSVRPPVRPSARPSVRPPVRPARKPNRPPGPRRCRAFRR